MKLHIVTIVLDGQPYIERHLPIFEALTSDWTWHIREGAATNTHCTKWCKPQPARLSKDGTHEYLLSIANHSRVDFGHRILWDGKVTMFNDMLDTIKEPCVLLEVDSDEIWTPTQIETVVQLFKQNPHISRLQFFCRYFLGPNIIAVGENCYGNNSYEWYRAWRFKPGQRFQSHEPPVLSGDSGTTMTRNATRDLGLVFDHYAYANKAQLEYKEHFYGYKDAVKHWQRLQENTFWPVKLREYLPWVDEKATADLFHQ